MRTIYQSWINRGISEVRTGELKNVKTIRGVEDIPFFKINIKRLKSELGRCGSPDKSDLEEQHAPDSRASGSGEAAESPLESSIDLL